MRDLDSSEDEISILISKNSQLETEIEDLQQNISTYKADIEQYDLIKSDLEMEKEALEEVLLKLRSDLKEKEEKLNEALLFQV